jgi:quercetin dioxygenase-like cupin family protein
MRHPILCAVAGASVLMASLGASADSGSARELMRRALEGAPGEEALLLTVEYAPGGASLPHRHDAQVFVYVLSGHVRMQVAGGSELTLGPGDTFYEGPKDTHVVSANASATEPARILVFMVKTEGAPVTRPEQGRP